MHSTDNDSALFSRSSSPTVSVSPEVDARSRKNNTAILQKYIATGQVRIAEALGVNESTVSRWKDGELERMAKLLAILGLKVVPIELQLMDPHQVNAILTLARAQINSVTSADQLITGES